MHDLRFLSAFLFLLEIAGCIHNLHQPPSVSLFSTLCSLPSFCSLHLLFSLLAIWLLQLCSLAYCRLCRCHQKLFTFQRFDAISHVHKTTPSTFCAASQTKRDGVGGGGGWGSSFTHGATSFSRMFPHILIASITSSITSAKGLWHRDGDWWSVSPQSRF